MAEYVDVRLNGRESNRKIALITINRKGVNETITARYLAQDTLQVPIGNQELVFRYKTLRNGTHDTLILGYRNPEETEIRKEGRKNRAISVSQVLEDDGLALDTVQHIMTYLKGPNTDSSIIRIKPLLTKKVKPDKTPKNESTNYFEELLEQDPEELGEDWLNDDW